MFAPILIGQLMGWPGIMLFAVPNVVGCALFGYFRSAERSRGETRDHAAMFSLFSAATVAFQVFFAGWLWGPMLADAYRMTLGEGTALAAGGIFAAAVLLAALPRGIVWLAAAGAFPLSLATFALLPWNSFYPVAAHGEWPAEGMFLVLPTIVFGFSLSPNLDLTFHRARQEVPAGARPTNFAVFGVAFASMLVLTVAYGAMQGGLNNPAVRAHMALQLTLTSALHLSELRIAPRTRLVLGVGAGLVGLVTALEVPGRETYLRYLGLYGLLFPAYALLALRASGRPTPRHWVVLLASCGAVTPLLDRGFNDQPTVWTPLAFVIPVVAILLATRRRAVSVAPAAAA